MIRIPEIIPSYSQGWATHGVSKTPRLWNKNVGAWAPFLGPTGSILKDHSGRVGHGGITGATWDVGKFGRSLKLNGTTDSINMGDKPQFNFGTGDFSLIAVVKTPLTWHTNNPLLIHSLAAEGYFFRIANTTGAARLQFFCDGGSGSVQANGGSLIGLDTIYCLGSTRDGDNVKCLVDGKTDGTGSGTLGDIDTSGTNLVIGADAALGGEHYKGLVLFVGVWRRVLAAAEQKQICADLGVMFRRPYNPASSDLPVAVQESIGAMFQLIGQSPIQTYSPGVNR